MVFFETKTESVWGTFCGRSDRNIDRSVAQTACKQLGYSGYYQMDTASNFGWNVELPYKTVLVGSAKCPSDSTIHILRCKVQQQIQ